MKLSLAQEIALEVIEQLKPFCTWIEVAGSTRRKCKEVNDIEIVLVRRGRDLIKFKIVIDSWKHIRGDATGRMCARYYTKGGVDYQIDIFMPMENDLMRQYAIRTGSSDYSARVIASAWVRQGWRGTKDGLRRLSESIQKGETYICNVENPTLPPVWKSEKEFFDFLNVKYVEPENRI